MLLWAKSAHSIPFRESLSDIRIEICRLEILDLSFLEEFTAACVSDCFIGVSILGARCFSCGVSGVAEGRRRISARPAREKTSCTQGTEFPTLKTDIQRGKTANLQTTGIALKMAKVRHKNTDKVSRRQGKAFLFDSCSLFRLLKTFANSHTNAYNFN